MNGGLVALLMAQSILGGLMVGYGISSFFPECDSENDSPYHKVYSSIPKANPRRIKNYRRAQERLKT